MCCFKPLFLYQFVTVKYETNTINFMNFIGIGVEVIWPWVTFREDM